MFLFKASGADGHDWCVHPPSDSLSNGWLPQAVEGRPFLSTALLIFHRETSPFLHSFTPPSSAAPPFVPFLLLLSAFCLFGLTRLDEALDTRLAGDAAPAVLFLVSPLFVLISDAPQSFALGRGSTQLYGQTFGAMQPGREVAF